MNQPSKEITITRLIDAPLEKVWGAWTDPAAVAQWWGPNGVTNPTCEWDARVGGALFIVMSAGKELGPLAGQEWPMRGVFQEVVPPNRLVFSTIPIDAAGNHLLEGVVTVTLEDLGGKTNLTVHVTALGVSPLAPQMLQGMEMGWNQQLDKLVTFAR